MTRDSLYEELEHVFRHVPEYGVIKLQIITHGHYIEYIMVTVSL